LNAGNPHEVTMLELAEAICAACDVPSRVEHLPAGDDDPQRRRPDITQIRRRYGWEPRIELADGLRETVAYFRTWLADQSEEIAA
jgi:nucleoside-diphosphate-sugar epimerase